MLDRLDGLLSQTCSEMSWLLIAGKAFFLSFFSLSLSLTLQQKPDGLIFPDRATLYVTAIEDRQYKDYKIHCE